MRINLTKKEIINSIYMQLGFSKKVSEHLLDDLLTIILNELIEKKQVKISNFGTFILRHKKSRVGRNPKTLEIFEIKPRKKVSFKAATSIKKLIN